MKLKKTLLVAGATGAVGLASVVGTGIVSAATNTSSASLVDKIALQFHLNKTDVQKVFDEDRAARESEMQARVESELTQAVADGKITAEQKTAILNKRSELQSEREANKAGFQNLTDAERKAKMDAERTALEKWATDNSIASDYIRFVMGGPGHGHGPGMGESVTSPSSNQ